QFALSELGDTVILTSPGSPSMTDPTTLVAGGYREDETFGATDRGVTLGRYIKSTGGKDFVAMSVPTRGDANAYPAVGEIRAGGALVNPGVVINEILYAPLSGDDEFIELYNLTGADVPLYDPDHPANTWKFTEGITFTFPEGATIPAGGYALVVPMTEAAFRAKYPGVPGDVRVFGPSFGVLDDDGESVELSRPGTPEPGGTVPYYRVDRVNYDPEAPWPVWAGGGGPSLSRLAAADYGNDAANWAAGQSGGTPGALNTFMDATPPSVPAAVAAVPAGAARIDVAWAPAFDDESGVGGYNVYRDGVQIGSSPTTSFSDTAVLPAITYAYRVAAVNGDGVESGQSAPSPEVRIVALSEASAPTATTVKATFSEMVGRDSAQEAANYQVTYGAGQSLAVASAILLPDRRSVLLTVAPAMASGTSYTVTATGIWSQAGFVLAPDAGSGMFTYTYTPPPTPPTYVLREYWTGITGTSVSNLTSSPDYPYNPGGTSDVTGGYFEAPTSFADNYGTRMRAVLTAPVTGNYTFYIASDDSSELWLNSGGQTESGRTLIASVSGYTSSRQWTKFSSQKSAAIYLQAGSHYYIEALQKDGTGTDNLAVTWVLPGGTFSSSQPPIATTYLSAYVPVPGYTVNVEATDWGAAEAGPDKGAFTLTRTGPTTQSLAVYYSITGTARTGDVGEDLTGTAVIPAGQSSVAIDVTPVDDDLNEPDETVVLTILDGDPVYAIGGQASATVTIVDNELPTVTAVRLNGRVGRGVSGVDPSGAGVRTLEVDFSEPVTFTPDDVTVQAVDLTTGESRDIMPVSVLPLGDARLVITLPDDAALDTWVKVTLSGSGSLLDLTGRPLDGESRPGGSGRGYIYSAMTDLPTGDGVPGGDAVFFVGSLRGDFSGDRTISEADKVGFTLAWRSSDPDADFRGVGFGARPPDGRITIADINGFTSAYQAGLAAGRHLDELPLTLGGSGAAAGVTELPALPPQGGTGAAAGMTELPALAPAGGVDVLAAAAGQILPLEPTTATLADGSPTADESDPGTDDLQVRPAPAAPAGDAGASAVLRIYSS
ncbi:MAG: lamin tail domain-containing protein, partial [Planctomycetes bacterium]|nr:lamin tail domain-containing protein [Planctomycetota bacterium]